jgi:hypothetical protein
MAEATLRFLQDSLGSYARSALPFLREAHRVTCRYLDSTAVNGNSEGGVEEAAELEECLSELAQLEQTYHSLSLNHVLRRASRAQGIALLTLYARSFSFVPVPASSSGKSISSQREDSEDQVRKEARSRRAAGLIDALKRRVRLASVKGGAPYGHLPTCWAVFTACLGVGLREYSSAGGARQEPSLSPTDISPFLSSNRKRHLPAPLPAGTLRPLLFGATQHPWPLPRPRAALGTCQGYAPAVGGGGEQ